MKHLRALIAALVAAVAVGWGRVRARWYRRRQLPTVRDELDRNELKTRPITAIEPATGTLAAPDGSPDYHSIPRSTRLLRGGTSDARRIASTRILPAPPRELAVLRGEPWNIEARRALSTAGFTAPRPGERALAEARTEPAQRHAGILRPELFGLADDLSSARFERRALPLRHLDGLLRALPGIAARPVLQGPAALGTLRPESFGLSEDARPAAELVPAPVRHPPKLPRAKASFVARYVDPPWSERLCKKPLEWLGESMEAGAEAFFGPPAIGAVGRAEAWELDDELDEQMKQVREQFLLRRDIGRAEYDASELDDIEGVSTEVAQAIESFTGLTFEALDPEPFAPLKLRLEAPPAPVAPLTEETDKLLAWMLSAIHEHPPEAES